MSIFACTEPAKKQSDKSMENMQAYQQVSPAFNSDSAYNMVQRQVDFGPRICNSDAHTACGIYLAQEFKKLADEVIEQKGIVKNFDGKNLNIKNIIASFNPAASKRILICTHWDTRPYADQDANPANHNKPILAADDAASGVAVMLEIARLLKSVKVNIGVDLICFDAEDLGKSEHGGESYCLGSQYWSRNKHKPGYKAEYGILLDMVGAYNAHFIWEGYSVKYAEPVLRKVWDQAIQLGYSNYFYYLQGGAITDDHYYVNTLGGIPTIDIIHYSETSDTHFAPHWHTLNDNMSVIDRNTLKAVGQTLLEVIYKESGAAVQ
ncbi:MAG: M28 family peptidase [Bacteroidia bacterium]|nr:M28 family peptidase [Bacteroidia bacterium]